MVCLASVVVLGWADGCISPEVPACPFSGSPGEVGNASRITLNRTGIHASGAPEATVYSHQGEISDLQQHSREEYRRYEHKAQEIISQLPKEVDQASMKIISETAAVVASKITDITSIFYPMMFKKYPHTLVRPGISFHFSEVHEEGGVDGFGAVLWTRLSKAPFSTSFTPLCVARPPPSFLLPPRPPSSLALLPFFSYFLELF
jgi:hypothetical protein